MLIADFIVSCQRSPSCIASGFQSATLRNRSASSMVAESLPGSLGLRWRRFGLGAFLPLAFQLFALCDRLLDFDLLARVVIANLIARPARDLRAAVAIGPEPMIASQRTNPVRL